MSLRRKHRSLLKFDQLEAREVPAMAVGMNLDWDVVVDGKITAAENFDSARRFGEVIAEHCLLERNAV